MRVNTDATNAHKIVWRVETLDGTATSKWWFHSGGSLPSLYLENLVVANAPDVVMQLTTEPSDARGSVCIFFKDKGVQRIDFAGQSSQRLNAEQRDQRCSVISN